jgi:hypothetical protein
MNKLEKMIALTRLEYDPAVAAEIERLRTALQEIADEHPRPGMGEELQKIAREALNDEQDQDNKP